MPYIEKGWSSSVYGSVRATDDCEDDLCSDAAQISSSLLELENLVKVAF